MFGALTGGMGCGKSTVLAAFEQRAWLTMDADATVHSLLAADSEVIRAVEAYFGSEVLNREGGVDRTALGRRAFQDAESLRWLERLLHPRVESAWEQLRSNSAGRPVMVEVPLLFEKNLQKHFEFSACIVSSRTTQLGRLRARGLSAKQIEDRLQHQFPLERKAALADYVIANNGSVAFLDAQVARLIYQLSS